MNLLHGNAHAAAVFVAEGGLQRAVDLLADCADAYACHGM